MPRGSTSQPPVAIPPSSPFKIPLPLTLCRRRRGGAAADADADDDDDDDDDDEDDKDDGFSSLQLAITEPEVTGSQ